jgi:hypothetical protein
MEISDIFEFLRNVFTEIGTMRFIANLNCEYHLCIRGIAFDLNRFSILSIAIFTDLMSIDLSTYI